MRILHIVFGLVAGVLVVASFLPLIETRWWAIRLLDFPRLQIGIVLLAPYSSAFCVLGALLAGLLRRAHWTTGLLLLGIASACLAHASTLWPYRPGGENFVGVHPKPPQVWQSSLARDASLYAAALLLRDQRHGGERPSG